MQKAVHSGYLILEKKSVETEKSGKNGNLYKSIRKIKRFLPVNYNLKCNLYRLKAPLHPHPSLIQTASLHHEYYDYEMSPDLLTFIIRYIYFVMLFILCVWH